MNKLLDHILAEASVSDAEIRALSAACASDSRIRRDVEAVLAIVDRIRTYQESEWPSRDALMSEALTRSRHGDVDSAAETLTGPESTERLKKLTKSFPALSSIVDMMADEATDFNIIWDESFAERARSGDESVSPRPLRKDRLPLRIAQSTGSDGIRDRSRVQRAIRWTAAASILTSFILFFYVSQLSGTHQDIVVRADADSFRIFSLNDGSSVRLSPGSSLAFASDQASSGSPGGSVYELDGSAFFSVVPQSSPFRVKTELATTSVLGTQFGIVENEHLSQVFLMEGQVSLTSNAQPQTSVILSRNESSRVIGTGTPTTPAPVDIRAALSWTDLILFRATPLINVTETLSRLFNVSVTVDPSIADLTFTNTFTPEQELTEILDTISLAIGVRLEATQGTGSYRYVPAD